MDHGCLKILHWDGKESVKSKLKKMDDVSNNHIAWIWLYLAINIDIDYSRFPNSKLVIKEPWKYWQFGIYILIFVVHHNYVYHKLVEDRALIREEGFGYMAHYPICKMVVWSFGCRMIFSSSISHKGAPLASDGQWVAFGDGFKTKPFELPYCKFGHLSCQRFVTF